MIPVLRDINRSGVSAFAAERARRILNGAALAFNNNVRTRGVIATGAPTINVGTGTAPSGHTRVYTFGDADMPFVSNGGRPTTASGRTTFPVVTPSSTRIDFAWRVETIVDGDSVAFLLDSVTANGYRFIVDGQYVSATTTTSAAGSQRYYQLSWATKAKRRVVVEGTRTLGFWGAAVKDMDGCFLPGDVDSPRLFVVGDSDLFMQDFEPKGDSYGFALGDYLGIRDTWCNGISSTGFVVNGGGNNYGGRRADWTTLPANSIDVLLFQLSYNDFSGGIADATLKAAIAAEITAARAAHPDVFILFTGCASWNDGSTQVGLAEDEVLAQQAIAESGDPLVGYIPVYTRTANWRPTYGITAAGDTGTGNTSRYVSFSSDHMNNAGNIHFGEWLARRVMEVIADLANVSAPTPIPAQTAVSGGGGGGSPAGANGAVQYNNGGNFGAAANVDVDANGNLVHDGYFDQVVGGIPAAPSAGMGRYFSRSRAGRVLPHYIGPSGVDVALQPAFFGNSIAMWLPGTGTTVAITFGEAWTARNAGTSAAQAHPTRASTNALTSLKRATFGTGTTATGSSGIQSTSAVCWRGNAAGLGGFFYFARFAVETFRSDIQLLVGLSALNAALAGEPSVQNNSIGICKDSTDTNWQIFTRSGSTTSKVDTGLAVAANTILDLIMFAAPNSNSVTVRLVNAVDGTVYVDNLAITTNLPTNTTFLFAHAQIRSTTGTTAALLALNRIYVETDL